jgi:hypothetical protein
MKVRTTEASGRVLDYLAAVAEGFTVDVNTQSMDKPWAVAYGGAGKFMGNFEYYKPSTDPAQGAPILFRERITIRHWDNQPFVTAYMPVPGSLWVHGKDPLEAGLRAYVHSKLGEEVDVPIQLTQLGE